MTEAEPEIIMACFGIKMKRGKIFIIINQQVRLISFSRFMDFYLSSDSFYGHLIFFLGLF